MKSITVDYGKRLAEEPGKGHNRWHEAIAPVVDAAGWVERNVSIKGIALRRPNNSGAVTTSVPATSRFDDGCGMSAASSARMVLKTSSCCGPRLVSLNEPPHPNHDQLAELDRLAGVAGAADDEPEPDDDKPTR